MTQIDDSKFFNGEGHIDVYAVLKENVVMYKGKPKAEDKCKVTVIFNFRYVNVM